MRPLISGIQPVMEAKVVEAKAKVLEVKDCILVIKVIK